MREFRSRLLKAAEEGLLLAVKVGLAVLVVLWTANYLLALQQNAISGARAAQAIDLYVSKGLLPNPGTLLQPSAPAPAAAPEPAKK